MMIYMDMDLSAPIGESLARFDADHRIIYANQALATLTDRLPEQLIGKTTHDLGIPPDVVTLWEQGLSKALHEAEVVRVHFSIPQPASTRHFSSVFTPERDPGGVVRSVLFSSSEAAPAPPVVPALLADHFADDIAGAHYKAIIECSDDAIISKTLDGLITSWNRGAQRIFGYSEAEMLYQPMQRLIPPERKDEEQFILKKLMDGDKVDHFETERVRKDGSRVLVSVTISPIRDGNGRIVGASKIARDITQLKLQQQRLRMTLEATTDGLWDWDLQSGYVHRSRQYYEVSGYSASEDSHDFAFFQRTVHPDDWPAAMANIDAHLRGKAPRIDFEYRLISRFGFSGRWMHVRGRVIERSKTATPLRVVGSLTDISVRKVAERQLQEREQQLQRVLSGSDQAYWELDLTNNTVQASPRWEAMLGYTPGEVPLTPDNWTEHIHPDDLRGVQILFKAHLRGRTPGFTCEMRCATKSGDWHWIQTRGKIVERSPDGAPAKISGTWTDVTPHKVLELARNEANAVFTSSYEGIMVVNARQEIIRVNPAFTRITGYAPEEVLGKTPHVLASDRHGAAFYDELWSTVVNKGVWSGEIWNRRKTGEIYAEHLSITLVPDFNKKVQYYVGVFFDISQIKQHEAELDRAAHFDPLTGIPNRRLLADRMEQSILRANRNNNALAVCYLDLDGFKSINDLFGHAAGDQVLREVTDFLKQILRAEDTLARLGGDEFVILLADITSPEQCTLILERAMAAINQPIQVEGNVMSISASIGVSLYPEDHVDADTLLRHADQAMYLAKDSGKNRFHLFDPGSDRKVQAHRQSLLRLREAIDQQEFRLYYQPKVNMLNGDMIGVEALIRWDHPQRGVLAPAEFLPLVYDSPLEQPLGFWVICSALQQIDEWIAQGLYIPISINISAAHLMQNDFVSQLERALSRHPTVPDGYLEIEILETAALGDIEFGIQVMQQCRQLGVHFALDDFGTGYSSLTYLRRLPIDLLKIDQSFVRNMLSDANDRGIVEGVIRMASAFRREVLAEGVETMAHGAALLQLGCHLAQGYGIARPMPADAVADWTLQWYLNRSWLQAATPL
jgi:diguanylate cyclase (GGDEF)-like protein/PAS domain S-box-containing protein